MPRTLKANLRYPWHTRLLLWRPDRVEQRLASLLDAKVIHKRPTLWQLELGVLRMWHRVFFRSETIGTSTHHKVRDTWRARLLHNRLVRGPVLLIERAIAPWDHTGLASDSNRLIRHLLAAHHDGAQFAYDFSILRAQPGALEELQAEVLRVVKQPSARDRWLHDVVVFDGYHEALLAALNRILEGEPLLSPEQSRDPDISFEAFIAWCLDQPASPLASSRAVMKQVARRLSLLRAERS